MRKEDNMKKKKTGKERARNLVFYLLIIGGIIGIGYNPIMDYVVAPYQMNKLTKGIDEVDIDANLERIKKDRSQDEILFDYTDVQSISSAEIASVHAIDKRSVIGFIYVPSIDWKTPILYGATHKNMLAGGGTLRPDQEMGKGNYSVAGHNHPNKNMMFAPIRYIENGDLMYMTDKKKVYTYKVNKKEVVLPNRVDVLEDNEDEKVKELTLMSCYAADGSNRIYVKGELVRVQNIDDIDATIKNKLLHRGESRGFK